MLSYTVHSNCLDLHYFHQERIYRGKTRIHFAFLKTLPLQMFQICTLGNVENCNKGPEHCWQVYQTSLGKNMMESIPRFPPLYPVLDYCFENLSQFIFDNVSKNFILFPAMPVQWMRRWRLPSGPTTPGTRSEIKLNDIKNLGFQLRAKLNVN